MSDPKPLGKHEVSQDPAHWKWRGFIYYNPDDKRLFPPKRNPAYGYTTNFANPRSVLALLAIIMIPLAVWGIFALIVALKK